MVDGHMDSFCSQEEELTQESDLRHMPRFLIRPSYYKKDLFSKSAQITASKYSFSEGYCSAKIKTYVLAVLRYGWISREKKKKQNSPLRCP